MGYASFPYSSEKFWLTDLEGLIATDTPVILLMTFEPNGGSGHYRTAIGYDDTKSIIYFSDPWGREQKHQTNKRESLPGPMMSRKVAGTTQPRANLILTGGW